MEKFKAENIAKRKIQYLKRKFRQYYKMRIFFIL